MKILRKKILISILTVILLFNNLFAAIVSDNDGAAFVTKAEFDALKTSFAEQIDNYNTSIDGKIDGAIAQYLSGIKVSTAPKNLYESLVQICNTKPIWHQTIETGSSSATCETRLTQTLHHTGQVVDNVHYNVMWTVAKNDGYGWFEWLLWVGSSIIWPSGGWDVRTNTKANSGYNYKTKDTIYTLSNYINSSSPYVYNSYYKTAGQTTKVKNWQSQLFDIKQTGAGSLWQTQDLGGRTVLKKYCTSWYPIHNIDVWFHTYLDYKIPAGTGAIPAYITDNGKAYTTAHAEKMLEASPGATVTDGTKYGDDDTNIGDYAEIRCSLMTVNDGNNYLNDLYSIKTNPTLYYVDEGYQGETTTTEETITINDGKFYDIYYTGLGGALQTNTLKGGTFKYKPLKATVKSKKLNEFSTNAVSSVAGVNVPNCAGIPIFETYEDEQTVKVEYKINSAHNNKVSVVCADKMFENGDVPAANVLFSKEIDANTIETFNVILPKKGMGWLFIKNNTNNETLAIENLLLR